MRTSLLAAIPAIALLATPVAMALEIDECPSPYDDDDCLITVSGGYDVVCHHNAGQGRYDCDGFVYADYDADEVHAISDDTDGILVWGVANGQEFCCSYGTNEPLYVATGYGGDRVALRHETDLWTEFYRETTYIDTSYGDDYVEGSEYDSCSYPCDDIRMGYASSDDPGDVAMGLDGDDNLEAPSNDTHRNEFHGGDGDDILSGGGVRDYLYGDDGDDEIDGHDGADYLYGGRGEDEMYGGDGGDFMYGGNGDDWMNGEDDRDYLYGQRGHDDVCGNYSTDGSVDQVDGGIYGTDRCAVLYEDSLTNCYTKITFCPSP